MNRQEYNELVKQLKTVPTTSKWQGTLDIETKERVRNRVMSTILKQGSQPAQELNFKQRFVANFNFVRYITPPQFAYAFGFAALVAVSGVFTGFARAALPGDTLYNAKIALEKTSVRFVSNPASRATFQMEIAGRRLQEAKQVAPESAPAAIERFVQEVKGAQETLKQAADPAQVQSAAHEIAEKADEYAQTLTQSRKVGAHREVETAAIDQAEQALKQVQKEVTDVANAVGVGVDQNSMTKGQQDNKVVGQDNTKADELKVGEVGL